MVSVSTGEWKARSRRSRQCVLLLRPRRGLRGPILSPVVALGTSRVQLTVFPRSWVCGPKCDLR